MKSIDGRLGKLEHRFGIARSAPKYLLILTDRDLESVEDSYVQILGEAGFFPTSGFGVVDLTVIPRGLNAKDEERFVRENGAEICGSRVGGFKRGSQVERDGTVQSIGQTYSTDGAVARPPQVMIELV
jgi:hypothetical protein